MLVDEPGSVTTLVRAALPAVPVVNLLPGHQEVRARRPRRPGASAGRRSRSGANTSAAYAEVCGFPAKDTVPLTYPHILGFPLHLLVMSDPAFPFAALGGVHLTNTITAHRAIAVGETIDVSACGRRTSSRTPRAAPSTSSPR